MAGTDTSRGINFQYACAIRLLIEFPSHPKWNMIQMEGDEDVEDVTIFDCEGNIVLRAQIKQKTDPHQWKPSEIKAVLSAFNQCKDFGNTQYTFIYSGAEGKELSKTVKPILSKLEHTDFNNLTDDEQQTLFEKLERENVMFLKQVGGRFGLQKLGTWNDIKQGDLRRLRKLLTDYHDIPVQDDEEKIYNDLFLRVAEKTEDISKFNRQLKRNDVLDLLRLSESFSKETKVANISISTWTSYLENLITKFHNWHSSSELENLIKWNVSPVPINSYLRLKPQFNPALLPESRGEKRIGHVSELTLAQVLERNSTFPILIRGDAGAGKSTCLRFLCYQTAIQAVEKLTGDIVANNLEVPILIYLRRYGQNTLRELIYNHFRSFQLSIGISQLQNVLNNVQLLLLLDGLDEVKPERKSDLIGEISSWSETYPNHRLIITTRKQPALSTVEKFDYYEIQPLNDQAVQAFSRSYLSNDAYAFRRQLEERGLSDFIRIPLLLTLSLIVFKLGYSTFDSLTDIYQQILEQYKRNWELPKRGTRTSNPFDWLILEKSLSFLAYHMIADGYGYTIEQDSVFNLLTKLVNEHLIKQHIWSSSKHNIADLLEQLLIHNLLEMLDNEVSFWHASFRDFFAAKYIVNLDSSLEEAAACASKQEWSLVTAFLDGLLPDSYPVREVLVSIHSNVLEHAYWPIETLRLIGNDTTQYIIEAISHYNFHDGMMLAGELLWERDFAGKEIFTDVVNLLSNLEYEPEIYLEFDNRVDIGYFNFNDFSFFEEQYSSLLTALSTEDVDRAKKYRDKMYDFISSFQEQDQWLLSRKIFSTNDFELKLKLGLWSLPELKEFCMNTNLRTSIPYLELIIRKTEIFSLRLEAILAVESIKRS